MQILNPFGFDRNPNQTRAANRKPALKNAGLKSDIE